MATVTIERKKLLIGGEWVDGAGGATFPVINPATEEIVAEVAAAGRGEIDAAVNAARVTLVQAEGTLEEVIEKLLARMEQEHIATRAAIARLEATQDDLAEVASRQRQLIIRARAQLHERARTWPAASWDT